MSLMGETVLSLEEKTTQHSFVFLLSNCISFCMIFVHLITRLYERVQLSVYSTKA